MKNNILRCNGNISLLYSLFTAAAFCNTAHALPQGGTVQFGAGAISQSGASMTIQQTSANLALNWRSFSIDAGQSVRFSQPSATAIALNRVVGQDPTKIFGNLSANGQIFLLNPNGVLFGQSAQVNVGGLVASTLSLSDTDFQFGRYRFTGNGTKASVVNEGSLTASAKGYIALLAPQVRNEGVVSARLGTALLAAGNNVTLYLDNGSLFGYTIERGAVDALADNRNLIRADGGQVFMSAKAADQLARAVVNNDGIIEARTMDNKAGVIRLLGDMDVAQVTLGGTSRLDASAAEGGNGGAIETSAAHVKVAAGAQVTTTALRGETGNWAIGLNDIAIDNSGAAISATTLNKTLGATSVSIDIKSQGQSGNGDIFVNDALQWDGGNNLTLISPRDINLAAAISAPTGGLSLSAARKVNAASDIGVGTFTLQAGNWSQNAPSLPLFSATDFRIAGGSFLRAAGGDGSTTSPYRLFDVYGLQGMGSLDMLSNSYQLVKDIDAASTRAWTMANGNAGFVPVGDYSNHPFTGQFDGMNHTISGLFIYRFASKNVGLFRYSTNRIANVGLLDADITGYANVGTLAGVNTGIVTNSYGTGAVRISVYEAGSGGAGGLVGYNAGTVSNAYSTVSLSGTERLGGIAGTNAGSIDSVYSTGAIPSSLVARTVGGLVGADAGGAVAHSYWNTDTSGQRTSAGGGVGLSAAQMLEKNFAGFDANAWRQYEGHTTPLLRSFLRQLTVTIGEISKTYDGAGWSGTLPLIYSDPAAEKSPHLWVKSTATAVSIKEPGTYQFDYTLDMWSDQRGYDIQAPARQSTAKLTINSLPPVITTPPPVDTTPPPIVTTPPPADTTPPIVTTPPPTDTTPPIATTPPSAPTTPQLVENTSPPGTKTPQPAVTTPAAENRSAEADATSSPQASAAFTQQANNASSRPDSSIIVSLAPDSTPTLPRQLTDALTAEQIAIARNNQPQPDESTGELRLRIVDGGMRLPEGLE